MRRDIPPVHCCQAAPVSSCPGLHTLCLANSQLSLWSEPHKSEVTIEISTELCFNALLKSPQTLPCCPWSHIDHPVESFSPNSSDGELAGEAEGPWPGSRPHVPPALTQKSWRDPVRIQYTDIYNRRLSVCVLLCQQPTNSLTSLISIDCAIAEAVTAGEW